MKPKLEESVPSNDQVNLNSTLQVEANRKQACCSWNQVGANLHVTKVRANMHSWIRTSWNKHAFK